MVETANIDTNYPADKDVLLNEFQNWQPLLQSSKLKPHFQHLYSGDDINKNGVITHIRVNMYPDGGISRIRVNGMPLSQPKQ